ncbi:hypothetical protein ADK61_09555 [Streptomyces sp. XY66]|uniref:hypothetical protein n=1 Tax=Streptomyces sp. XY66 TaxID=1415563 RepID=UPI0006AFC4A4|nr:hypothetical protein [Streptomyces sp. XY66]KOU80394.1 hypothetical protein ADK61_09555 [Streptomyces sp. XY66]
MHSNLPELSDSELLAIAARAAKRTPVKPNDLLILTELQLKLYRELHAAAGQMVRPPVPARVSPASSARVRGAIDDVLAEEEEMAVFRQMYDHLANAALGDQRVADQMLALSSGQHGAGRGFLKRMLRFAAADVYPNTVQMLVVDFLKSADEQTLRAALAQLAGMEWALDPDDRHQRMIIDPPDVGVDDADTEVRRFRELGLRPGEATPGRSLARSDDAVWETPDEHRIRTWRRRYVEAHRQSLDWARAKAEVYRRERERLAPYGHPDGLEAAVVTQLRQEADRASSARLFQIGESLGQMALRRVVRRAEKTTTPFDPAHLPASRGMLFLDTPLVLPNGRRIVGYVWGPWSPRAEEGWFLLRPDRLLEPVEPPYDDASWTWVTALTCDESLLQLPFSPYETLLARPGEVLDPETRLRDPDSAERYRSGSGRQGGQELMLRHVRALWELLTQHKRSTVRVLAHQVHQLKPSKRDAERRRGISDSGQVENWWVDPDAGERFREQQPREPREGGTGRTLAVRYWRDEHERQQCPNSHQHSALDTEKPGSCPHYEITIPEHPVGPADAPWSDRLRRARLRPSATPRRGANA